MLRPLATLAALCLAACPAAALSVSVSSCNDQSAELVGDGTGTTLTVNGSDVPLEQGYDYEDLLCVSRDGETRFGLIRLSPEGDESYFLLDPGTLELTPITAEEAAALDFWEDEDDWGLDRLEDD